MGKKKKKKNGRSVNRAREEEWLKGGKVKRGELVKAEEFRGKRKVKEKS